MLILSAGAVIQNRYESGCSSSNRSTHDPSTKSRTMPSQTMLALEMNSAVRRRPPGSVYSKNRGRSSSVGTSQKSRLFQ